MQKETFFKYKPKTVIHLRATITLWLDMIIAQSDAHSFDVALTNNGLQPVGPRSVEAFQRTDVDSTDYD